MQDNSPSSDQQEARWLEAKITGQEPVCSVMLQIRADTTDENPPVSRYIIGQMGPMKLPCGIDHFESLEEAQQLTNEQFGITENDWVELSEAPEFAETFDTAIDNVIDNLTNLDQEDPAVD